MPLNPFNKCFRAAATQKKPLFAKIGQKMPIFSSNQCFLGPDGQFVPPPPYFGTAGLKKRMCYMPWIPFNKCFSAATSKKKLFFAQKWPKNANFYPKSVCSGSDWSACALPPCFEGAGPKKRCIACQ